MTGATATSTGPRTLAGQALLHADPGELRALALRSRHDLVVAALRRQAGGRDAVRARLSLAAALAGMGRSREELLEAVAVYEQVLTADGPRALPSVDQRHLVQAAFLAGRHDLVAHALAVLPRLTDAVVSGLRADLANPVVDGQGALPHADWERLFGARFRERGLEPPAVSPDGGCLFDGLRSEPARSVDGPLVTVIVPAYRPEEGLVTSLRSILAQSHGHLEVLLVDDCSGEEYAELFERAEALDPRVRLLRQERNGGSYLARNTALGQARGELVTTQDADDWSHPERVAAQVALMAERPSTVASRSAAIRCRPDLTRQWFGYSPERMNASSLMVRRDVLERLGGFDRIRKGADSELVERLRLLGEGALVDVRAPLAVTRLAEGSLSRADFSLGRHSPDRVLFRSAFRWWHAGVAGLPRGGTGAQGAEALEVDHLPEAADPPRAAGPPGSEALRLDRQGNRPFPVPRSFVRDLPGVSLGPTAYPLVVLTDLALPLPEVTRVGEWGPVGVLGREDLTHGAADLPTWHDTLVEAGRAGVVDLLTDTVPVHAQTLVVTDASLLALPALPPPELSADRVLVVAVPPGADQAPRDLEEAGRVSRGWWGRAPIWVARDEADRAAWAVDGWDLPLLTDVLSS